MSQRLESLVVEARAEPRAFDPSRSLGAVLAKKEAREHRRRLVRRSVVALSGGAVFALLVIRASIGPASAAAIPVIEAPHPEIATCALDDGGFARD
jgi:hypothetical protein